MNKLLFFLHNNRLVIILGFFTSVSDLYGKSYLQNGLQLPFYLNFHPTGVLLFYSLSHF